MTKYLRISAIVVACSVAMAGVGAAQSTAQTQRANTQLYWSGIVIAGIGGALTGWGLGSEAEHVVCAGTYYVAACQTTGINKMAYVGTGLALVAGGWTMAAIGNKRVTVAPTLHGVKVGVTFPVGRR